MNKKDYALTRENLAHMDLFEPFYNLYSSYREILSRQIIEFNSLDAGVIWSAKLAKATNHQVRDLFNAFFEKYTYVFIDDSRCFHTNKVFMNRINIYELRDVPNQPLKLKYAFSSFPQFLFQLEWAVAHLICNRNEKELSCACNEEVILQKINKRIQEQVEKGKSIQLKNITGQTKTCQKLIVYENLKLVSCNQKGHEIISEICYCKVNDKNAVRLPVHTCHICNKYFIGQQTLKCYEQIYGSFIVSKIPESKDSDVDFDDFGMSELYKTGYNVKEGGMTDVERQMLLKHLIDTKQLSCFAIIRDLENAIHWHESVYANRFAVERWKKDLMYVNSLITNTE